MGFHVMVIYNILPIIICATMDFYLLSTNDAPSIIWFAKGWSVRNVTAPESPWDDRSFKGCMASAVVTECLIQSPTYLRVAYN